ncbi:hypothetical protein QBC33DRAFT_619329 [Phialemonium atrogriseum]|uniref:Ig-like domain-containing protein n=1 Tax=Phialemonium atrogriseum TaxID=1093897 RepID=A0AAJ0FP61_9PEZI|nr:uncharacterized protein QBC33DRAFT_619329 [Phialemonium atrogriseum]KAK1767850.1 hypothetical protein QBC33DRAFT_619329 [Phialemonium atrogriseum]
MSRNTTVTFREEVVKIPAETSRESTPTTLEPARDAHWQRDEIKLGPPKAVVIEDDDGSDSEYGTKDNDLDAWGDPSQPRARPAAENYADETGESLVTLVCTARAEISKNVQMRWLHLQQTERNLRTLEDLVLYCPYASDTMKSVALNLLRNSHNRSEGASNRGYVVRYDNRDSRGTWNEDSVTFLSVPFLLRRRSRTPAHIALHLLPYFHGDLPRHNDIDASDAYSPLAREFRDDEQFYVTQLWCLLLEPESRQPLTVRIVDEEFGHFYLVIRPPIPYNSWQDFMKHVLSVTRCHVSLEEGASSSNFTLLNGELDRLTPERWITLMEREDLDTLQLTLVRGMIDDSPSDDYDSPSSRRTRRSSRRSLIEPKGILKNKIINDPLNFIDPKKCLIETSSDDSEGGNEGKCVAFKDDPAPIMDTVSPFFTWNVIRQSSTSRYEEGYPNSSVRVYRLLSQVEKSITRRRHRVLYLAGFESKISLQIQMLEGAPLDMRMDEAVRKLVCLSRDITGMFIPKELEVVHRCWKKYWGSVDKMMTDQDQYDSLELALQHLHEKHVEANICTPTAQAIDDPCTVWLQASESEHLRLSHANRETLNEYIVMVQHFVSHLERFRKSARELHLSIRLGRGAMVPSSDHGGVPSATLPFLPSSVVRAFEELLISNLVLAGRVSRTWVGGALRSEQRTASSASHGATNSHDARATRKSRLYPQGSQSGYGASSSYSWGTATATQIRNLSTIAKATSLLRHARKDLVLLGSTTSRAGCLNLEAIGSEFPVAMVLSNLSGLVDGKETDAVGITRRKLR